MLDVAASGSTGIAAGGVDDVEYSDEEWTDTGNARDDKDHPHFGSRAADRLVDENNSQLGDERKLDLRRPDI